MEKKDTKTVTGIINNGSEKIGFYGEGFKFVFMYNRCQVLLNLNKQINTYLQSENLMINYKKRDNVYRAERGSGVLFL